MAEKSQNVKYADGKYGKIIKKDIFKVSSI